MESPILLCSAAKLPAVVVMQGGQTTEGAEMGDKVRSAGDAGFKRPGSIKEQILCAAELTSSFCLLWPIVFLVTKSV